MSKVWDMFFVSILWAICCIPGYFLRQTAPSCGPHLYPDAGSQSHPYSFQDAARAVFHPRGGHSRRGGRGYHDKDAKIVIGHHAKSKEELKQMIEEGRFEDLIRVIPVKKGDFFQILPGTVHAIKGPR